MSGNGVDGRRVQVVYAAEGAAAISSCHGAGGSPGTPGALSVALEALLLARGAAVVAVLARVGLLGVAWR